MGFTPKKCILIMANNNTKSEKKKENKFQYYFAIAYPEHFKDTTSSKDIVDYYSGLDVKVVVSCLHDRDKKPDGGDKKSHFHVLLYWKNSKAYKKACEFCKLYNLFYLDKDFVVKTSYKDCIKYMMHIEQLEKAQYSEFPVSNYLDEYKIREIIYGGFTNVEVLQEMFKLFRKNKIYFYHIALNWLYENKVEFVSYFIKYQSVFNNYFASHKKYYDLIVRDENEQAKYHKMYDDYDRIKDIATNEIERLHKEIVRIREVLTKEQMISLYDIPF